MAKSLEGVLVKKAHQLESFTHDQIVEFAKCADAINGPEYFMSNYFYIQHPTKGRMLYEPYDYQKRLIHAYHNYRYSISLMPRQTGKCFRKNTIVKIKNIYTGIIQEISIGDFYDGIGLDRRWIPSDYSSRGRLQKNPTTNTTGVLELSDQVERKFVESYNIDDYLIFTDTGWEKLTNLHKTIPYEIWKIQTESGLSLECADTHIVFDEDMNQIFVNDIEIGTYIQTDFGISRITQIENSKIKEYMFDVTVDSNNHRFYTNGILSHNSTSAAGYLLWYAMFVPDSTILIAAHKYTGSQEIMQRIRYAYELCPDFIRAGATSYNKGNLDFDNGSRIISTTTTENTGRGLSISLLYCDEFAFVRPTIGREFWTSISPTLSTGGKCIITSTPNSDEDQFATLWKGANKCIDEFGNEAELGINGFKAFRSYWNEHPDRDEKWANEQRAQLGVDRFRREMGCLAQNTKIEILDGLTHKTMDILQLFEDMDK